MKGIVSLLALLCAVLAFLVCSPNAEAGNRGRFRQSASFSARGFDFNRGASFRSSGLRVDQFGRVFFNGVPVGTTFNSPLGFQHGGFGVQSFQFRSAGCR